MNRKQLKDQNITKTYLQQHTPMPWQRQGFDILSHGPNGTHAYFLARCQPDNGKGVVRVDTEAEAVANADFIVRAVNSHEALLRAAKLAIVAYREQFKDATPNWFIGLLQAIKQAEGK